MSWTCHEHAEAWRRSNLLSTEKHGGAGDTAVATSTPLPSYAQPLTDNKPSDFSGEFSEERSEEKSGEFSQEDFEENSGETSSAVEIHQSEAAAAAAGSKGLEKLAGDAITAAARGDDKKGGVGGKGVGLGMFAKIKGRFARRKASARGGIDRKQKESGA